MARLTDILDGRTLSLLTSISSAKRRVTVMFCQTILDKIEMSLGGSNNTVCCLVRVGPAPVHSVTIVESESGATRQQRHPIGRKPSHPSPMYRNRGLPTPKPWNLDRQARCHGRLHLPEQCRVVRTSEHALDHLPDGATLAQLPGQSGRRWSEVEVRRYRFRPEGGRRVCQNGSGPVSMDNRFINLFMTSLRFLNISEIINSISCFVISHKNLHLYEEIKDKPNEYDIDIQNK